MNTDLLVSGYMHRAYFVQPHTEGYRDADFPTAVMSIPVHDENGRRIYTGGAVVKEKGKRYAAIVSGRRRLRKAGFLNYMTRTAVIFAARVFLRQKVFFATKGLF